MIHISLNIIHTLHIENTLAACLIRHKRQK